MELWQRGKRSKFSGLQEQNSLKNNLQPWQREDSKFSTENTWHTFKKDTIEKKQQISLTDWQKKYNNSKVINGYQNIIDLIHDSQLDEIDQKILKTSRLLDTQHEKTPLIFYTNDGKPVTNRNNEIVHYPIGARHLLYYDIVDAGKKLREPVPIPANPIIYLNLFKFHQGNEWDIQRLYAAEGSIDHIFRDISTIVIGLYGAAAGIPKKILLEIQNIYAAGLSNFHLCNPQKRSCDPMSKRSPAKNYSHIAELNVDNMKKGYEIYYNNQL